MIKVNEDNQVSLNIDKYGWLKNFNDNNSVGVGVESKSTSLSTDSDTGYGQIHGRDNFLLKKPSPNYDARPDTNDISLLVIHNISLPPAQFGGDYVIDFFQNNLDYDSHEWFENIKGLKVSAHFFIRRCGQIVQFVSTLDRAWHAGVSSFKGREKCNDFSIGIELEGTDTLAYTENQYQSLDMLYNAIKQRHGITDVCGHEHIAPGRKTDPGPAFDWSRLV